MPETPIALTALLLAATPCALFLWNLTLYRRPPSPNKQPPLHGLSILIPARNEEHHIRECVEAALASEHVDLEVIVADDGSTDGTPGILRDIAARDSRLKVIDVPPLPEGWGGKTHACHHLGRAATKLNLFFVDADVRLQPDCAAGLAAALNQHPSLHYVSGAPLQLTRTWSEKLLIPLIHFLLLGYLPLWAMRRFRGSAFGAGIGQTYLVDADAYRRAGGHEAIRATRHDGLKLARSMRSKGSRTDLVDLTFTASCRLYTNASEVWNGLLKNATEGLGSPTAILPMTIFLLGGQVAPFLLLALHPVFHWQPATLTLLTIATICALLPRILAALRFRQSILWAFLHPIAILLFELIQWTALLRELARAKTNWKGRDY